MRQNAFKNTFQPLEIAIKKALGIRKVYKGKIFDSQGFVIDSREKITRYIFFLPLFQKVRILTNISEFSNATTQGGAVAIYPRLNPRFAR